MHYGQSGHLAQSCPKQSHRTPISINAHAAILEDVLIEPEHKKKNQQSPCFSKDRLCRTYWGTSPTPRHSINSVL